MKLVGLYLNGIVFALGILAITGKKLIPGKRPDTLLAKIEAVHQRNAGVRHYRSTGNRAGKELSEFQHTQHGLSHGDDDIIEAIVMKNLIIRIFHIMERSLKVSSRGLRILGDTAAGLASTVLRSVGGVMNVLATLIGKLSDSVDGAIPKDPMGKALVIGDSRTNLVTTLKNVAKLMSGMSHACIWGGEITETLTSGLGEAVEDSFRGLELITRAGHRAVHFIFMNDFVHEEGSDTMSKAPNKTAHSLSHTIRHMPTLAILDESEDYPSDEFANSLQEKSDQLAHELQAELAHIRKLGFSAGSPTSGSSQHKEASKDRGSTQTDSVGGYRAQSSKAPLADDKTNSNDDEMSGMLTGINDWVSWAEQQFTHTISPHLLLRTDHGTASDWNDWLDQATFGMGLLTLLTAALFVLVWSVALVSFESAQRKASCLFLLLLFTAMSLLWVEYHQRRRLIHRTASSAVATYLSQQVEGFQYHPTDLLEDELFYEDGSMVVVKITNQGWYNLTANEKQQAENIAWANIMVSSLWTMYGNDIDIHGVGSYVNDLYEEMLTEALSNIPPGIANLRLKRFDLGTNPPFLKAIKGLTYRNHSCIRRLEDELLSASSPNDQQDPRVHYDGTKRGFAAKVAEWEARFLRSSPFSGSTWSSTKRVDDPLTGLEERYVSLMEQFMASLFQSRGAKSARRARQAHKRSMPRASSASSSRSSPANALDQDGTLEMFDTGKGLFDHFSVDCDRLILDLDFVYMSKDMDIVLSLRPSDLRSVMPDVSVTLSEVRLVGEVRLAIQLTKDYPFFGNATVCYCVFARSFRLFNRCAFCHCNH
jgi:hypothetical protein